MKSFSFSLYGQNPKYNIGAYKNLDQLKTFLPDWSMRLYYHKNSTDLNVVEDLIKNGAIAVDMTDITINEVPSIEFPMFWRFLSFCEDGLSLSRDLDSRISQREVDYIRRWENKDEKIFIIRDHPWHAQSPGGLFGIKNCSNEFKEFFYNFLKTRKFGYNEDQIMLEEFKAKTNSTFYCGYDNSEYIPRDNKNFFIGMQIDENEAPICKYANNHLLSMNL